MKGPIFLFDITRNSQKAVFTKPRFFVRVFTAKHDGSVKFVRYNEEFDKNHVRYREGPLYTFVIYLEEPLFMAQSTFNSVPLPAITRRKESKNGPLPHFAILILLSLLRSSSLQQMFAVPGIFYVCDAISLGKLMCNIHE